MVWSWILVIVLVPIAVILMVAILLWIMLKLRRRMERMGEALLDIKIAEGLSTVKHLAYPMVLTGAWEVKVMIEAQMRSLHEGLRAMGKQFVLDTLADIEVLKKRGL